MPVNSEHSDFSTSPSEIEAQYHSVELVTPLEEQQQGDDNDHQPASVSRGRKTTVLYSLVLHSEYGRRFKVRKEIVGVLLEKRSVRPSLFSFLLISHARRRPILSRTLPEDSQGSQKVLPVPPDYRRGADYPLGSCGRRTNDRRSTEKVRRRLGRRLVGRRRLSS